MASTVRTLSSLRLLSLRPLFAALTALALTVGGATIASADDPLLTFVHVPTVTITGTAKVGATLTATYDAASIDPAPDTELVQWFSGDTVVGTGSQLVLQPGDLGSQVSVVLTVSKEGYESASVGSASTAAVVKGTQSFTPAISGTVAKGFTLSVKGLPAGANYAYKWKRNGANISGATKATYKPVTADIGKKISVTVTATKTGYTTLARTSAATAAVKKVFTSAYTPVLTGTAKVGFTLKATTKAWSPAATLKYQWYRNGVAISGATATTRKLSGSDAGAIITVKVTGSRSGYLTLAKTSKATAVVAKGTIAAPTPKITGTTRAGNTLKVTVGTVSPSTATKTFQWYRNGVAIVGATSTSLALKNVDAGKKITVKVTYALPGHNTKTLTSAATATILVRAAAMKYDTLYSLSLPGYQHVKPGIYVTNTATSDCYWVRDNDANAENGAITDYWGPGRWIVEIAPTDAVFYTEFCGSWFLYDWTGANSSTIAKDGYYGIGADVRPGVYARTGGDEVCYVTIESNASGEESAIEHEFNLSLTDQVTIDGTRKFFTTWGCGTWTRVGDVPVAG